MARGRRLIDVLVVVVIGGIALAFGLGLIALLMGSMIMSAVAFLIPFGIGLAQLFGIKLETSTDVVLAGVAVLIGLAVISLILARVYKNGQSPNPK